MNGNSLGTIFRITTWGESHGPSMGVIVDGCPSGLALKEEDFREDMLLRQGGTQSFTTQRKEEDRVIIESGVFEGLTTGTPISLRIENKNIRSSDYDAYREIPRPGHADYTSWKKQGHHDFRGGGRSSARETVARVAAAVIARKLLALQNIQCTAFVSRVGDMQVVLPALHHENIKTLRAQNPLSLPLTASEAKPWMELVENLKNDSLGGALFCFVDGLPAGLGEPIFDKLNATLAHALMSLPAAVSFECGGGHEMSFLKGSEIRDPLTAKGPQSNKHGGLLGGMTSGTQLHLSVGFHAPTSIPQKIESFNLKTGKEENIEVHGRHDSVPLPRAIPMVEAMTMITLVDALARAGLLPQKLPSL